MRRLVVLLSFLVPSLVFAAGSNYPLDKAEYDLTDQASLQRGAQIFMNYCMGCHQAQYQRYQRTFEDIGVPLELGQENLQFTGEKVGDYMKGAMPKASAEKWFGTAVPDLTLVARVRGADWLYTYLRTFYVDENRPFGVNNKVFPDVGMPHALQELQGVPYDSHEKRLIDGQMKEVYVGIKSDGSGALSPEEYDQAVLDLVNFMVYLGEPSRLEAEGIGRWVIIFILVFFVFAYLLKKEYWRDVH
jgi:ubiquinol-cytochrome c reductase cytochrome c1 subunit